MDEKTPEIIQTENLIILEDNLADAHDEETILDKNTIILAAGDAYSLFDMEVLKSALKQSHKSYEDIAEEKGISVSSIYKFISKKSKSPSFYNTIMLFDAAGVSVDELCNLSAYRDRRYAPDPDLSAEVAALRSSIADLRRVVDTQTQLIETLLHDLHRSDDY